MSTSHASAALALVSADQVDDLATLRDADDVARAFLAGYRASTRECYRRDLKHFGGFLARLNVTDPLTATRVHVDLYCRQQEFDGVAPATTARRLAALSGFFGYAVDADLIDRSPMRRIRRPRSSDESPRLGVDREQLRRLLDVAEADGLRSHALACLLGLNGLRISETLELDVDDLAHERGHRTIALTRKGGKKQRAPLAPRTAAALDELLEGRDTGPVFRTRCGKRWDRHAAAKTVSRLARLAGVEHRVSPHSLRHGFVTAALDAGCALRDVQDAAGHADPRTTRRYDRGRYSLDRHCTYAVAAAVAA